MEPLTLSLIAGGISWAANAYAAYEAGEINERQYQEAVRAANALETELKKLRPDQTWQDIKPELFQKAAEYVPDIAAFVEENAPQIITEAGAESQKRIQRQALQKYAAQAETGRDVIAEGQREQALFEADARAKQRQQMLMERMKQQGLVGSGAALAAQLQGEQAERQAARQESIRGTQEAEMRRRQALGEAAQLAGQMRQADFNVESSNVQTMNAFNQRLANARNIYNRYASNARNEAQLENQRRQAAVEQANIELRNKYAIYNREGAMTARERARQYDVNALNKMYDVRSGLSTQRAQNEAQNLRNQVGAFTGALGVGMQAYGLGSMAQSAAANAAAKGAETEFWKGMGKNALQGAAQGLARSGAEEITKESVNLEPISLHSPTQQELSSISGPPKPDNMFGPSLPPESYYGPPRPDDLDERRRTSTYQSFLPINLNQASWDDIDKRANSEKYQLYPGIWSSRRK